MVHIWGPTAPPSISATGIFWGPGSLRGPGAELELRKGQRVSSESLCIAYSWENEVGCFQVR